MRTDSRASLRTGLDLARADGFSFLKGRRVGLLSHAPAVDAGLNSALGILTRAIGDQLKVVFTPEHGYFGYAQDLEPVSPGTNEGRGPRWVSLYGNCFDSLTPRGEDLKEIDTLVVDLVEMMSTF